MSRKHVLIFCLAAAPIVWLAGCGGGDKDKGKKTTPPPSTGTVDDKKPATTDTDKPADKGEPTAAGSAEGWGTIKGQIVLAGDAPEPEVLVKEGDSNVKDAAVCSAKTVYSEELVVNKENKGIKWVLVYVNKPSAIHPDMQKAEGEVELGQEFCHFIPHFLAFRQGQNLKVSSSDPVGHNTNMSPFKNPSWNQIIPAPAAGEKNVIDGPELTAEARPIKVQCNVHAWMTAWLYVTDHPYFAVTDENGAFEIKNVPAGKAKVVIWQEKMGYDPEGKAAGRDVAVTAGEATDLGQIKLDIKK